MNAVVGQQADLAGRAGWQCRTDRIFVLSSVCLVMPVSRPSLTHAPIGAVTAAALWELSRQTLPWHCATLSQISMVYRSLTIANAVLLNLELAATLLIFGAQVIAECERMFMTGTDAPPQWFTTDRR